MKRSTISWGVKQVCGMIDKGTIVFDNPLQRPAGQWKVEDESLLADSALRLFIPDIYVIKYKKEKDGKEINIYDVIDGKQRLTTLHKIRKDGVTMTELEDVMLDDGETYNISGKKYSEFDEEVRDAIDSYSLVFRIIELEDGDDEEEIITSIFYRLNNGKAVSKEHLALVSATPKVQKFVHETITNHPVFTKTAHFADGAVKKSGRQSAVMQTIALIGDYEWKNFGNPEIERVFDGLEVEDEVLSDVTKAFDVVHKAFEDYEGKFVTKVHLVSFAILAFNEDFSDSVVEFLKDYKTVSKKEDAYRRWCGQGGTKKTHVEGRVNGILQLYNEYIDTRRKEVEQSVDEKEKSHV